VTGWRVTGALRRAVAVGGLGAALAALLGDPVVLVLTAPFLGYAVLALVHRPSTTPHVSSRLEHTTLHEGQGTRAVLEVDDLTGVEHVARLGASAPFVATHPADGRVGGLVPRSGGVGPAEVVETSPRRWGRRTLGHESVALTSRWAGYRWGPVVQGGRELTVLPVTAPYDSRAEAPHPVGLVGAHRSRRAGTGTEFADIRAFHTGDRLRRINWRVSLRTGDLHVVSTRAEEDTGVLLVVDALADHGRSGGLDGDASSLDVSVRATAAIAEHAVRRGDRVGLRVVAPSGAVVRPASGQRHLRRLLGRLAVVRPGPLAAREGELTIGAVGGSVVVVVSPMLSPEIGTATATLARRGVAVLVVDPLPYDVEPAVIEGTDPVVADLAWRMRLLERDQVLSRLAAIGCPVVPWRGPGTLDEVLRRLARRAQLPTVRVR
jgi:uncharacterized protein (DUF58 family)